MQFEQMLGKLKQVSCFSKLKHSKCTKKSGYFEKTLVGFFLKC